MPKIALVRAVMGPEGPEVHIKRGHADVVLLSFLDGWRLAPLPSEVMEMKDGDALVNALRGRRVYGILIEGDCDHKVVIRSFPNDMA